MVSIEPGRLAETHWGARPQSLLSCPAGDETTCPVMICLLGNFRLECVDQLVPTRPGGKREAFLALLALQHGRRVVRDRLVDSLWPDGDPLLRLNALNNIVYQINRLLGPALKGDAAVLHEDGYYRLNVAAGLGVDITRFDDLVAAGNRQLRAGAVAGAMECYGRAAELYRDDLQVSCDPQAIVERERLRATYLTLLAQMADNAYQRSDDVAALEYLWRLLARDPSREDAHRLVMRCYLRRGERTAAMRQYQVCVRLLHDEFDAAPEPATTALFDLIRTQPGHM